MISFPITYTSVVMLRRDFFFPPLYDLLVLLWSGIYLRPCTGTWEKNVSPSSLSLGGIPESYSDCTLGGIRGRERF